MTSAPTVPFPPGPLLSAAPKDVVSTALGSGRVWATVGQGIVTEVYWPSTGEPQTRDLGFFVAGDGWSYEVKALGDYQIQMADPSVPLAVITHTGPPAHPYTFVIESVPHADLDVLLVQYQLRCDDPTARVYPFLASHVHRHPHVDADQDYTAGADNVAVCSNGALFASAAGRTLCLAGTPAFTRTSVGIFGVSDLWHDFQANGRMAWSYSNAGPGFVVLSAESPSDGVLALAFADVPSTARSLAESALADDFAEARARVRDAWHTWSGSLTLPPPVAGDPPELADALRQCATVIRAHEDVDHPGAFVASLSIPWGDTGNSPGGYHLVWPRDAVESGFALLALGHSEDALRLLDYLRSQQLPGDGHWPQNFFPDGTAYWHGVQLDETALPVLLAARLADSGVALTSDHKTMINDALTYLVQHGPLTDQDRWEEDPGGSPFTLGVMVAALVAGADYLDDVATRKYVLDLADDWNARIEEWTYVEASPLDQLFGIGGHYVRVGPHPASGTARIANQTDTGFEVPSAGVLGLECLYLARLGLREPHDQRLTDTLRLIDAMLARDVGTGIAYYRYNYDGYGEHIDGANWTGVGVGRVWPLLAGERGHHAVLAGGDGLDQLRAMLAMRSPTGMVPEQVWDQPPLNPRNGVPSLSLMTGSRTLSAMPLVWAHSELVKLACLRATGTPVERVEAVTSRYAAQVPRPGTAFWRTAVPVAVLPPDTDLVVEDHASFTLHYGHNGWADPQDVPSTPLGLGMHGAHLSGSQASNWSQIDFIRHYADGSWDGLGDQHVEVGAPRPNRLPSHSGHSSVPR